MNSVYVVKKFVRSYLPWVITILALYVTFRGVDFTSLLAHLKTADAIWISYAIFLTFISYILRAYRWEYFFINPNMRFVDAVRVLFLGFFMNNILPARAGELVRAHSGSQVTGETRTLVLATIASERLADGLTISLMFLIFAAGLGDPKLSHELFLVALAFGAAGISIIVMLYFRSYLFRLAEILNAKFQGKTFTYILDRLKIFLNGLTPLLTPSKLPGSIGLSIVIWCVELAVYYCIAQSYNSNLSLALCVLFMVAVNFSSLIPAAPGGIGVIELIASSVLVSVGVDKEHALTMVLTQHAIQYLVVGIPGLFILFFWKTKPKDAKLEPV
jgi:uncharacterized protein (TIRG00374 family)